MKKNKGMKVRDEEDKSDQKKKKWVQSDDGQGFNLKSVCCGGWVCEILTRVKMITKFTYVKKF